MREHREHRGNQEPARAMPGPRDAVLPPRLVGLHKRSHSTGQQDQRGAEGEKDELRRTTGNRVERRPTTGADPYRGDCQEYDCGHRNADAEPDGVENTLSAAGVAVVHVFSSAVHG